MNRREIYQAYWLLLIVFILVMMTSLGCAKDGKDGASGSIGTPGEPGRDGSTGPSGADGSSGYDGISIVGPSGPPGRDGIDAPRLSMISLCPGITSYPGVFIEVGICISGQLYAVYSDHGGFLTLISPGSYHSFAIGSACDLTVGPDCEITH